MVERPRVLGSSSGKQSVGRTLSSGDVQRGMGKQADGRETASQRGYTSRWSKASATVLAREPICWISKIGHGLPVGSEVVDHLYPHCRLSWLFWDKRFWVPMSKRWHDSDKQRIEGIGELAIDELAFKLGLPTLAQLWPDAVSQWRQAMQTKRHGGGGKFTGLLRKPPP